MTPYSAEEFPDELLNAVADKKFIGKSNGIYMLNAAAAFDTETSSFRENGLKRACMYIWQFGVEDLIVYGRTWDEFESCMRQISETLELSENRLFCIYVHNLAFDFQFFAGHLEWQSVFASDSHHPIYARTTSGIEFRCSFRLSNMSLAATVSGLGVEKRIGDLDYNKTRHSGTPLTETELGYCEYDIICLIAFIRDEIKKNKNINRIPLTKTGYVRRYCRNACTGGAQKEKHRRFIWRNYMDMIGRLVLTLPEYQQLQRGFQGGFTHASAARTGKRMQNVHSRDISSSYPFSLLAEKYPMSRAFNKVLTCEDDIKKYSKGYGLLFDVTFYDLREKLTHDHPLSASRCYEQYHVIEDNGRVVSADLVSTTLTDIDYRTLKTYYTWGRAEFGECRAYRLAYLPKDFILAILTLYNEKTSLKGVTGKLPDGRDAQTAYPLSKGMVNSAYGMTVTAVLRQEWTFDNGKWEPVVKEDAEQIEAYNTSKRRFLFYPWGVWCAAWSRAHLFDAINELGDDYCYSDTDSVKYLNRDKHEAFFDAYNKWCDDKLRAMCDFHGIDYALTRPKTIKGVEKPLGHFEYEGMYDEFKTLGAKRYAVRSGDEYSITVAGVGKKEGLKYMLETFGPEGFFKAFDDDLEIPPERTSKLTHIYIDEATEGIVTDYTGMQMPYRETGSVHMEPAGYVLSMSDEYINYLLQIAEEGQIE